MATRETRADRGRRQGLVPLARLISELVDARKTAGVSQQALARVLGWSQSAVSRFERMLRPDQISLVEVAQVASALGLAFGGSLYPLGDPLRDKATRR